MKKFGIFLVVVIVGLVLTAASLNKNYRDKNVPITDHAFLNVERYISFHSVDGNRKGAEKFSNQLIPIPAGEHTIRVRYFQEIKVGASITKPTPKSTALMASVPVSISDRLIRGYWSSEYVNIPFNFEAGHHYFLYNHGNLSRGEFILVDETEPSSAWDKDRPLKDAEKRIAEAKKVK